MTAVRAMVSSLMSKGVISPGWYSILTGLALLAVLTAVPSTDPAALLVGVVFGVTAVWMLERGIRSELRRKRDRLT